VALKERGEQYAWHHEDDRVDEVGEEAGSWKGGVLGCGYTLLPNETPLQCLRRMEKERKF
jgi:hypothetical protein